MEIVECSKETAEKSKNFAVGSKRFAGFSKKRMNVSKEIMDLVSAVNTHTLSLSLSLSLSLYAGACFRRFYVVKEMHFCMFLQAKIDTSTEKSNSWVKTISKYSN
jgi:F0F1-type ATP synthase gamma subunit